MLFAVLMDTSMRDILTILIALFILSAVLGVVSCTKKEQPDTIFTRVAGRWKKVQFATDDNNNGVIDQQEIRTQPVNFIDVLSLNSDTTGYQAVNYDNFTDTAAFKWFVAGDSLFISYKANLSLRYYIERVNSINLTIVTSTSTGLAWYNYVNY